MFLVSDHMPGSPKCTGTLGAFEINDPSAFIKAQLKSSLSLMLVEMDVCCSARPMASATDMNRFELRVQRHASASSVDHNRTSPRLTRD